MKFLALKWEAFTANAIICQVLAAKYFMQHLISRSTFVTKALNINFVHLNMIIKKNILILQQERKLVLKQLKHTHIH